jgi:outer membrane protein assembly factor BamB
MGGTLTGADYLPQYLTAAYDAATGRRLWTRLFAGQRTQVVDSFAGLAISPDGSFVVVTGDVCCMPVSHYEDWATVAYEAQTGRTVWMRTFNGPTYGSEDESGAVTIAPGSNVVVVAGNSAEGSNLNATTVAYDAGGATLWARAYDGPGHGIDASGSVATSPDGSAAFVSGSTTGVNGFSDILTIAYSLV